MQSEYVVAWNETEKNAQTAWLACRFKKERNVQLADLESRVSLPYYFAMTAEIVLLILVVILWSWWWGNNTKRPTTHLLSTCFTTYLPCHPPYYVYLCVSKYLPNCTSSNTRNFICFKEPPPSLFGRALLMPNEAWRNLLKYTSLQRMLDLNRMQHI